MKLRRTQILSLVNQHYPSIGNIARIEELNPSGINSKNFLIITKKEKFILKQFLDDTTIQKMEKICKIMKYCTKKNIKISEPIHTIEKKFVIRKYRMYLIKYYDGKQCSCKNKEIRDLAKNLSLLHNELRKITPKYRFSRNNRGHKILNQNEILEIEKKIKRKQKLDIIDKQVIKRIDSFQEYSKQVSNFSYFHKTSKQQLIHNDLIPSNAIFKNNRLVAIIDFGSLQLGSIYDDLVYCSFRFIIKNTKNSRNIKNKIAIFLKNYEHKDFEKLEFNEYKMILLEIILKKISILIREKYVMKSNLWNRDFRKFIGFLEIYKLIS
jgi:Ser/Thr protein kinase RdoA (MazF antagonist)